MAENEVMSRVEKSGSRRRVCGVLTFCWRWAKLAGTDGLTGLPDRFDFGVENGLRRCDVTRCFFMVPKRGLEPLRA